MKLKFSLFDLIITNNLTIMRKLFSLALMAALTTQINAQKVESFDFDCGGNSYSFKGIRMGDAISKGVNGNEYYYENTDGKTAVIYRVQYYSDNLAHIHKVNIPISAKLSPLKLAGDNFTFNINGSYGAPKNSEEKCDCKTGEISKREGEFMPVYGFGFVNDKQKGEFQKLLDKLNATVEELKAIK